jgi:hypothetical protein
MSSWTPDIVTFSGINTIGVPGILPSAAIALGVCANPIFRATRILKVLDTGRALGNAVTLKIAVALAPTATTSL